MIGTFFDLPGHNADTLNGILAYESQKLYERTPDEISDVFEEEKGVQFYVNQNDFNKTFEVLAALPEEPEEGLAEKAQQVQTIAEEIIKEHINARIESGKIATQAELPNTTLEDLNGIINTVWDDTNQEIEAEGLTSILETQSVGWEIKLEPRRQIYYLDYTEYAAIDDETRNIATRVTEILKKHVEMQVLSMQTIIGEDRVFHATNEYKLNTLLDDNWEKITKFAISKGIDESLFTLAGWCIRHDDEYGYYYVDIEPYGEIDDEKRGELMKISSITARAMKKLSK